jgi:putative FmdB family regulatory protein
MPIFEYRCPNCGHCFEKLVLSSKRQRELSCPECGNRDVQKAISLCGSVGKGKSGGATANCAPGG